MKVCSNANKESSYVDSNCCFIQCGSGELVMFPKSSYDVLISGFKKGIKLEKNYQQINEKMEYLKKENEALKRKNNQISKQYNILLDKYKKFSHAQNRKGFDQRIAAFCFNYRDYTPVVEIHKKLSEKINISYETVRIYCKSLELGTIRPVFKENKLQGFTGILFKGSQGL